MTLRGGPAAKLGNRYELWWTVSEFVRLLRGDTEAIRIEDPGVEKAEFVVTTGTQRELHQAKRHHPKGKWSLAALRGGGLLEAIGEQLAGNDDRFVFASSSDAPELSALCDDATGAESVEELERAFLAEERKKSFKTLLDTWKCDAPTAIGILRRIMVRTIDERGLENTVRWAVRALFLTNWNKVVDALRALAENSVHRTITRTDLIGQLSRHGYQLRQLTSPAAAGVAVSTATDRYLSGARARLIRQRLLPREAAKTLLERLGDTATDCVMTGKAGAGKTACVVEVVNTLREQGIPVLAFRLDRFLSAPTTVELGQRLDLEESPVLVLAAAAEAAGKPGVLIIDQVDVVSTLSGRTSSAFDLVEQLLLEARGMRARVALHVVVVCREFDWRNDSRLRQLIPSDSHARNNKIDVDEFTLDQVKAILTAASFDPREFRDHQLKILQLPQNLSLFLEAGFDPSRAPGFGTATEIFDRYWDAKRQLVADRAAPAGDRWMEVMETLCGEMTSTQQLSMTKEKLDGFPPDYMSQMASEGVITFDDHVYGFGHESFFDYCFARVFAGRKEPLELVAFLKASEQHLFRRAQVRQVLAYLRERDQARYITELRNLLLDNEIRPHLKDLAFALLAEVQDPIDDERAIWKTWIEPTLKAVEDGTPNQDKLSELAWRRLFGSRSWFEDIDQRGLVECWLSSGNDQLTDMAVSYLRLHQRHSPDRVAALLGPYVDLGGEWAQRLRSVFEWSDLHTSRSFFDLFLRLVENGVLDEARGPIAMNSTFWDMLYTLGKNRPEWFPEVLAHRLRRRLVVIRTAGKELRRGELLDDARDVSDTFLALGEQVPAAFVEHMLPVVLQISDTAATGDELLRRDAVWTWLVRTSHPDGEDACLSGLARALAALARNKTYDLQEVIVDLRGRDTDVSNHLLLALYRGGATRYADEAISLLCTEPWRFECRFSDSPRWCAIETIQEVVPHCSPTNRERLEGVILGYVSPYERTKDGYASHGRARFALLSAIPAELRSASARAHTHELERKFGEPEGEPREIAVRDVKSPIEKTAADKMNDDQWLRAILKYDSDGLKHGYDGELYGGASQLAQVLQAQVKENPDRFARLSLTFPRDANPVYLERTLDALKNAAGASDLKLQVCNKAFAESRGPCGKSIADVLGSVEDPLPDDAVQILCWLATEHEDPSSETWQYDGDIYTSGINTARGRAAEAIRELIFTDATCVERFRPTLERMIGDRSASVLSCVAGTLRAVIYHDPALGMALFHCMNLAEDRLLATPHVYEFIRRSLRHNFGELRPTVERMLRSSEPEVCEAGARLASIAALEDKSTEDLVDEALRSSARHHLGVAQVASGNIAVPECRAWSEAKLIALFNDIDADVRSEAASCFRHLPDEALDTCDGFIAAFCSSQAFKENSWSLLHALEHALGRLPGTTCVVCEKLFDRFADEARDAQTGRYGDTYTVAKLVFRTYQQHQNDEWTSRSLDLIDRFCLEGIPGAGDEFEQFER